jgi:hypothetical protein
MKIKIKLLESEYFNRFPSVRGELTIKKVIDRLKSSFIRKTKADLFSTLGYLAIQEICKFSSPKELMDNIYWHGTSHYLDAIKAGAFVRGDKGSGYDFELHTISVTKSKKVASIFATVQSNSGMIYPVLLKKGATLEPMPDLSDSIELEEMLLDLYTKKVDAVKLSDWNKEHSEQEVAIFNPSSAISFSPIYIWIKDKNIVKILKNPPLKVFTAIYKTAMKYKNDPATRKNLINVEY